MAVNDCDLGRLVSLPANLPVRGTVTSVLSLLLRHEHPELGVAIRARARTVIHAGVRVDPDFYIWIPGLHVPCRSIFFLGGRWRTFCGWRRLAIRSTRLAISRPISCLNRRTFSYVLTAFRIPVPTSARTVVDAAGRVDPNRDLILRLSLPRLHCGADNVCCKKREKKRCQ